MRSVEDRLGNVESLLESVISKSTLIEPQENLISSQEDFSNPETTTIDLPDDTVDGMGAIAFADELASGHFGKTDA